MACRVHAVGLGVSSEPGVLGDADLALGHWPHSLGQGYWAGDWAFPYEPGVQGGVPLGHRALGYGQLSGYCVSGSLAC